MAKVLKTAAVIVGGAALIATGVGAIVGAAAVTAAIGVSAATLGAISTGLALGASLLAPKAKAPKVSEANQNRLFASIVANTTRTIALGSTALSTDIRDEEYTDSQTYFHRFIVTSAHKIHAVREIWFDDKKAWDSASGVASAFAGYLTVDVRTEGSAANAINISPRMGSSRRYTGCSYVHLRYKLTGDSKKTDSPFAQSVPSRITIIGDGALVYDPRLDSTAGGSGTHRADDQSTWAWDDDAARNPALLLLWYLLGWRIQNPVTGEWLLSVGKGIPPARIDLESFITAANLCDEPVTKAAGGTEPRYRADGVFAEGDDPSVVLDNLKAAMNAVLDDVDGKIRLTVLHNDLAVPVAHFTEDDVLGAFKWAQTPPLSDTFNVIRGGYTDPSTKSLYQLVDYPEVRLDSPDGIDRTETVNLALVQSPSQAQRLVKQRLQRSLYGGTFTAEYQATAWKVQKGDVITQRFAALGWEAKAFRVVDTSARVDGVVPMILREEHPDVYAWDAEEAPAVQAAEPTSYDGNLAPLVIAIGEAAETATWDGVAGDGKPEDNATVGAPPGTDVGGRPVEDVLADLDKAGSDIDDLITTYGDTASAAASADAADQAKLDAQAARDAAATAQTASETAASNAAGNATLAGQARDAAELAKADAEAARTGAQSARDAAQTAKTGAETARDTAIAKANDASGFASTASGYADAAQGSAGAAQASATTASTKADDAQTAADAAAGSATTADTKATDAAASASAAENSRLSAEASANMAINAVRESVFPSTMDDGELAWRAAGADPGDNTATGFTFTTDATYGAVGEFDTGNRTIAPVARIIFTPGRIYRIVANFELDAACYVGLGLFAADAADASLGTVQSAVGTLAAGYHSVALTIGDANETDVDLNLPAGAVTWRPHVRFNMSAVTAVTGRIISFKAEDITIERTSEGYASAASEKASEAGAYADDASTSAAAAQTARTAAQTAKTAAETARDDAVTAKTDAEGSASTATSKATIATNAANAAQSSASAASDSATTASSAADDAGQSASIATTQAVIATTKAGEASASETNAASSASDAEGFKNQASSSATLAAGSAGDAADSADAAASSASSAQTSKTEAASSASAAQQSAISAKTQAATRGLTPNASFDNGGDGFYRWADQTGPIAPQFMDVVPSEFGRANLLRSFNGTPVNIYGAPVSVVAGRHYQVSAGIWAVAAATHSVLFYDATGALLTTIGVTGLTTSSAWLDYSTPSKTLADFPANTATIAPTVQLNTNSDPNRVRIDYLRLDDVTEREEATASAGSAETHAANAEQSADNASASASAASGYADTASSKAGEAAGSADAAATSASGAATSANEAGQSASAAQQSKVEAQTAADTAQNIQKLIPRADFNSGADYWVSGYAFTKAGLLAAPDITNQPEVTLTPVAGLGQVLQCAEAYRMMSERGTHPFIEGQLIRVRIKTRLTSDQTAQPHGQYLWITTNDATGGNSGYASVATWTGLTVADGWVTREVVFEPFSKMGSASLTDPAEWRLMLGLNGYTTLSTAGAIQQIASIEIDDVTQSEAAADSAAAAAISASSAAVSKEGADQSASSATTSANTASTKAGEASASAGQAASSASDAEGYKNQASSYSTLSASYMNAGSARRGLTPNASFDAGVTGWFNNLTGTTPLTLLRLEATYQGSTNVIVNDYGNSRYTSGSSSAVDPSRKYRARGRFYSNGAGGKLYAGFMSRDANDAPVGVNSGLSYALSTGTVWPEGWHDITSAVITGTSANSTFAFRDGGTVRAAPVALTNYDSVAGQIYAFDYLYLEDVTESEAAASSASAANASAVSALDSASTASTASITAATYRDDALASKNAASSSASTATSQASIATAQAAAAQQSASIVANASIGALNPNAMFTAWTGTYPDNVASYNGATLTKVAGENGNGNAVQVAGTAGMNRGLSFLSANTHLVGNGYYVLEADVELNSGTFAGAGLLLSQLDVGESSVGPLQMPFSTTPDNTGNAPGNGVGARIYRFRKLVRAAAGADHGPLYGMAHYSGLGSVASSNSITFYRVAIVPATDQEIAAQQATTDISSLNATVASQSGAIADLETGKANASTVTALSAQVEDNEAAITDVESVAVEANGIAKAIKGFKQDVNGFVSGMESVNDGTTSTIKFLASVFEIVSNGTGTTFQNGIWRMVAGSYRLAIGPAIGSTGNMVLWYGLNSVAIGSETIANSKFALGTDGKVYTGSDEITGGGGGNKLLTNATSAISVGSSGSTETTVTTQGMASVASGGKLRLTLGGSGFTISGTGSFVAMNIKAKVTFGGTTTTIWTGQITSNGSTVDLSDLAGAASELANNPGSGAGTFTITVSRSGPTGLILDGTISAVLERIS